MSKAAGKLPLDTRETPDDLGFRLTAGKARGGPGVGVASGGKDGVK